VIAGRGAGLRLEEAVVEHVKGDHREADACERRFETGGSERPGPAAVTLGEDTCGGAHAYEGLMGRARCQGGSLAYSSADNPPTLVSAAKRGYRG